jgi:hypothetical protein
MTAALAQDFPVTKRGPRAPLFGNMPKEPRRPSIEKKVQGPSAFATTLCYECREHISSLSRRGV